MTITASVQTRPLPWRWDVEAYVRMHELGIIPPEARTELLDGEILVMSPIGYDHMDAVAQLNRTLVLALGDSAVVWPQNSIMLDAHSLLQPDLAVLSPRPREDRRLVSPSEAKLVIEVANTSLRYDRGRKLEAYARAGIPELWIVALPERVLDVHRRPEGSRYLEHERHDANARVTPAAFPEVEVAMGKIFPPEGK